MLSISPMTAGQESYYAALASETYYTESGEPPGTWWGEGASVLGLRGEVDADELSAVVSGFNRSGDCALVSNAGAPGRRPGFDCTFSAPKSVSLRWALAESAERREIAAAHQQAVFKALTYLQGRAGKTRRGAQGRESWSAALAVALFEHSTARAVSDKVPDPHLHTHCLVMNACLGADGRWGSLDARELFRHKMAAGVLYRTELFSQLRRGLGLTASRRAKWVELDGVDDQVLAHFSKRRKAIESMLEERGRSGAKHAARAAIDSRETKTTVNRRELFPKWREAAQALGFRWNRDERGETRGKVELDEGSLRDVAREALDHLSEHHSHFAERDLLRAVLEKVEPLGVSTDSVRTVVSDVTAELVPLAKVRGEVRYTTREMLQVEQEVLDKARQLSFRRHTVDEGAKSRAVATRTMSAEQEVAFRHVTGRSCISFVQGLAGTGKSYMLGAAREAFEESGFTVHGVALAAVAAKRLEGESGIASSSIHKLLFEIEKGRTRLDRRSVVVVDEAGMVGTRLFHRLLSHVEKARAKIVFVGDEKQLAAVEAGGPFASLLREHEHAELSSIRRQRDEWARRAVRLFSEGRGAEALAEYARRGFVYEGETDDDAFRRLAEDWDQARSECGLDETLVLTGTRAEAAELNRILQHRRFEAGELEVEDAVTVGDSILLVGDRVRFRRNSLLVTNGQAGEVVALSSETRTVTVRLDGSEDRVTIDLEDYEDVELGYAQTTHSAQGATVDRALVFLGGFSQDRESTYVQASRARFETRFYLGEGAIEAGGLEALGRRVETSRAEGLAIELLEREIVRHECGPKERAA